jgi:hypothetical protein
MTCDDAADAIDAILAQLPNDTLRLRVIRSLDYCHSCGGEKYGAATCPCLYG